MMSSQHQQQQQVEDTSIPKIYTIDQIQRAIESNTTFEDTLLQAIENGFIEYEQSQFYAAPIQTLGLRPHPFIGGVVKSNASSSNSNDNDNDATTAAAAEYAAQTCVKSGYFTNNPYYVIKVATGGKPLPTNWGCMQIYSQYTGKLQAILLDDGILTEIRTACIGSIACKYLAPKLQQTVSEGSSNNSYSVGIVGTGIQARYQLDYLQKASGVLPWTGSRNLCIWGRNSDKVQKLIDELSAAADTNNNYWNTMKSVDHPNDLLLQCQLIITTTSSTKPLLGVDYEDGTKNKQFWNEFDAKTKNGGGLHITCIGSDAPGKCEIEPNFITKYCNLCIADSIRQSLVRGEYQFQTDVIEKMEDSNSNSSKFISLGNLLQPKNMHLHRQATDDNRITIFDSSGIALQDCIISQITYETILEMEKEDNENDNNGESIDSSNKKRKSNDDLVKTDT